MWNYRNFRGSVTGYYTAVNNATERFGFYDESINTYTNNTLAGVKRVYKGIEVGMEFKASPTVTLSAIGSFARAQYKNNPQAAHSPTCGSSTALSRSFCKKSRNSPSRTSSKMLSL